MHEAEIELIRRQIASGSYETDAKLDIAADRLLQRLRYDAALIQRISDDDAGDRLADESHDGIFS